MKYTEVREGLMDSCCSAHASAQAVSHRPRPAALPLALNMAPSQEPTKSGINIDGETEERCPQHHLRVGWPILREDLSVRLMWPSVGGPRLRLFFAPRLIGMRFTPPGSCAFGLRHLYASHFAEKFQQRRATAKELPCPGSAGPAS